ncbi:hypothetical protein ABZ352_18510 [Streptomyces griseofuscus]|uniref:hypothetical protein n=1 Tax=Streptomyces griseofuscus TaxID=146922 RepID=UPI0033C67DA2
MTNTRTTPAVPDTAPEPATVPPAAPATPSAVAVVGPPLRPGQEPEKVAFAHHLRIAGRDYRPGDTALLSPDYARQLRGNGYLARGRS